MRPLIRRSKSCFLLSSLLLLPHSGFAATLDWPGAGACGTTLQACINGSSAGDTIRIQTEGQINETLAINNKSLTLTRPGAAALFAPGRNITINASSNNINLTLSNLSIAGTVQIDVGSGMATDTQNITLDNMRIVGPGTAQSAISISQQVAAASTYSVTIKRSYISQQSAIGGALFFNGDATGTAKPTLNVFDNQIIVRGSGVAGFISAHDGTIHINGNRIGRLQQYSIGGTLAAGVFVSGGGGGGTPASVRVTRNVFYNFDSGVFLSAAEASLVANVVNNTVARTNIEGIALARTGAETLVGRVANNIVDRAANCGLNYRDGGIAATHDFNLYSRGSSNYCGTSAGGSDVVANAGFRGQFDFRSLGSTSPQVNSGSNVDQPQVVLIVPIALPDIDGRAGRVAGTVDIGAHERSFDQSFDHVTTASNVSGNATTIANPPVSLLPSDLLTFSTFGRHIDSLAPLPADAALHRGVWFSSTPNQWTIFNQLTTNNIVTDRRFFVLLNVDSQVTQLHTAIPANTSVNVTTLNHPQLNNQPDALPIVTQHWDPAQTGSGVYNNSAIGVWYDTAVNRWKVFNQVPSSGPTPPMPDGAAFNVLIPNPLFAAGSHAYRTEPLGVPVTLLNLDHPLLNNHECAHLFVTSVFNPNSVYVPSNLVLSWNEASAGRGNWAIERGDGQQIPAGAAFHVYIDPQQSRLCTSLPLFSDGFED